MADSTTSSEKTYRPDTDLARRQRMLGYTLLAFGAFCADVMLISQVVGGALYVAVVAAVLRTHSRPVIMRTTLLCSAFAAASLGLDEGFGLSMQSVAYYGGTVAIMWLLASSGIRSTATDMSAVTEGVVEESVSRPASALSSFEQVEAEAPEHLPLR